MHYMIISGIRIGLFSCFSRAARFGLTKMIQKTYTNDFKEQMATDGNAKPVHLFSDIKVEEDTAISVFVYERNINE